MSYVFILAKVIFTINNLCDFVYEYTKAVSFRNDLSYLDLKIFCIFHL